MAVRGHWSRWHLLMRWHRRNSHSARLWRRRSMMVLNNGPTKLWLLPGWHLRDAVIWSVRTARYRTTRRKRPVRCVVDAGESARNATTRGAYWKHHGSWVHLGVWWWWRTEMAGMLRRRRHWHDSRLHSTSGISTWRRGTGEGWRGSPGGHRKRSEVWFQFGGILGQKCKKGVVEDLSDVT